MPERSEIEDLLHQWIARRAAAGSAWVEERRAEIEEGGGDRVLFLAFSLVPRKVGKEELDLSPEDMEAAERARTGWRPDLWSTDQAARVLLVLSRPSDLLDDYLEALDRIFVAADVGEAVALYQGLPVLPHPEHMRARAAEGLRTNMTSVFEAVALHNPYPAEELDEAAWNQMVLKALFVGSSVHDIQGLDERTNPRLSAMLLDFVRERRSAGRSVDPGLWRCLGPHGGEEAVSLLRPAFESDDLTERRAAALALARLDRPAAADLLAHDEPLAAAVRSGGLGWDDVASP